MKKIFGYKINRDKLIGPLIKLISILPLPISRGLGRFIGNIFWLKKTRQAFICRRNLDMCFPELNDSDRGRLARSSMADSGALLMETPAIWLRGKDWAERSTVEVEGLDIVNEAIAKKKGIIFISPHLGNWEILGVYLAQITKLTCLFQPPKNQYFCDLIKSCRENSGINLAPTNQRGVLQLLKTLKAGDSIGILPDQIPDMGMGVCSEFYKQPARTMTLTSSLLKKTQCSAVMAFAQRQTGGFKIVFKEPDALIYSDDLDVSVKAMNLSVENCIADAPEQYCWEYQRLRDSEEGVDPYR